MPGLGVFGDDDVTVGHDDTLCVLVARQSFEPQSQTGFDPVRTLGRGRRPGRNVVIDRVRAEE
jgi:hypothetical protein